MNWLRLRAAGRTISVLSFGRLSKGRNAKTLPVTGFLRRSRRTRSDGSDWLSSSRGPGRLSPRLVRGLSEQPERDAGACPVGEMPGQVPGQGLRVVLPDRLVQPSLREDEVAGGPHRRPERQAVGGVRAAQ